MTTDQPYLIRSIDIGEYHYAEEMSHGLFRLWRVGAGMSLDHYIDSLESLQDAREYVKELEA